MSGKTPARQLILEAVVTCIEKYGIEKLTTRKIAEEAGTNIASINYYFRSKDDLLAEAMRMTINHMMEDVFAAIDNRGQSFEATLKEVIFYLVDGAARFPGISTAHFYDVIVEKRYDSLGGQAMRRVFEGLAARAAEEFPRKDPDELRFVLVQIFAALLLNMLTPGFFPVPEKFQPLDAEHCQRAAEQYVRLFFAAV